MVSYRMSDQNLLYRAPPCFKRHVKPLVPDAFAVVSTHQPALGPRGYGPFSLCVMHKEGLCPSSKDINRLMMIWRTADAVLGCGSTITFIENKTAISANFYCIMINKASFTFLRSFNFKSVRCSADFSPAPWPFCPICVAEA
jgi:hypothetical protein